jgi:hypothetical protein
VKEEALIALAPAWPFLGKKSIELSPAPSWFDKLTMRADEMARQGSPSAPDKLTKRADEMARQGSPSAPDKLNVRAIERGSPGLLISC